MQPFCFNDATGKVNTSFLVMAKISYMMYTHTHIPEATTPQCAVSTSRSVHTQQPSSCSCMNVLIGSRSSHHHTQDCIATGTEHSTERCHCTTLSHHSNPTCPPIFCKGCNRHHSEKILSILAMIMAKIFSLGRLRILVKSRCP